MTVEKVLCDLYKLDSSSFAHRASRQHASTLKHTLQEASDKLPILTKYVGGKAGHRGRNSKSPYDFLGRFRPRKSPNPKVVRWKSGKDKSLKMSARHKTVSIKSNEKRSGLVCPPEVGQASPVTYTHYFKHLYPPSDLATGVVPRSAFLQKSRAGLDKVLPVYLKHLFDCDYLLWAWTQPNPGHKVIRPSRLPSINWSKYVLRPTNQQGDSFNIYADITAINAKRQQNRLAKIGRGDKLSLGNFQVHGMRSSYKYRVNLQNLLALYSDIDPSEPWVI